jgi:O-methyltransferase domain/Dimerisation domain
MTMTDDPPPQLVLQELIQGYQVTQCIYVAARLGIADLLSDGARRNEDLAQATGTHAPSLYRVLRLLTAVNVLIEVEPHSFALAPLGTYLRSGVPGSMRSTALLYGDAVFWHSWGDVLHSVETGEAAFDHTFGVRLWDYIVRHPEQADLLDQMMTDGTASVAPTVATGYDFSTTATLVDVGGGHGQMLASILQAYPHLHGILFDLPHVVRGAPALLDAAGVADRCEVLGGDLFTGLPAGHETYLLSRVIHDWDDTRATAILCLCKQAVKPRGKVLLVERVIQTGGTPPVLVLECDTQMLVVTGGKERTEVEYRGLLNAAGFEVTQVSLVLSPFFVIEAVSV